MRGIQLKNLKKSFGATQVIRDVSLTIEDGEFCVFVGPSGCGKSTLLRIIAGLETVDSGSITINDRDVTALEPYDRGLSMVFQSYALYPHMTVRDNIAFALSTAKMPKAEIATKVAEAARMLQLGPLLDRKPAALSGGQRQRVAIGRAIVREPAAFLFDEPLSNLDAALRVDTRAEIAALHRQIAATMIYVTHDQIEAMTLADRIVVLNAGQIMQVGSPRDLYERPANTFVAQFLGTPKMNLMAALAENGQVRLAGGGVLPAPAPQGLAQIGLRPEHLNFCAPGEGQVQGQVAMVEYHGPTLSVAVDAGVDGKVMAFAAPGVAVRAGEPVGLRLDPTALHLFDASGQRL